MMSEWRYAVNLHNKAKVYIGKQDIAPYLKIITGK